MLPPPPCSPLPTSKLDGAVLVGDSVRGTCECLPRGWCSAACARCCCSICCRSSDSCDLDRGTPPCASCSRDLTRGTPPCSDSCDFALKPPHPPCPELAR